MVAGHTRLKAMRAIAAEEPSFVPTGAPGPGMVRVIFHEFASENDADAYAMADNRLSEGVEYDEVLLREHILKLSDEDKLIVGVDDIDLAPEKLTLDEDEVPPLQAKAVSKLGDIYVLGRHRVMCGSSTEKADMQLLMGADKANLLWTDPPYNVAIVGGAHALSATERKKAGKKTIDNDAMSETEFRSFLTTAFQVFDEYMLPGTIFYIAHADVEGYNFRGAVRDTGWKHTQLIIWYKDSFVLGRQDYHSIHESILYGWKEGAGHLRLKDRTQTTVWEFPRPKKSEEHPTMKPIELIERAIRNSTIVDGIVLDGFGGSGSTLIAAERTGRISRLMELDPRYVDVIVKRWEQLTGEKATRIRKGKSSNVTASTAP
jgi:DNA modification methylase